MYRINIDKLNERNLNNIILSSESMISRYKWKVEMLFPDSGDKKEWNIGAQNVPLESIKFSLGEKGCEGASLKFNRLDFPVYYGNEVKIYRENKLKYRGFVSNIPNPISDTIKVNPYIDKLDSINFNTTFSNYTFKEMLQETINLYSSITGVFYNENMLAYTDETVYEKASYKFEKISKLPNDYYKNEDDTYWGVQENGFLYIRKRSTTITKTIYAGEQQSYMSLTQKKDYSKIKETRQHIFQKSTVTDDNIFIATIPDGTGTYPYLDLELIVGRKDNKVTAPEGLNSTECKDWAYANLLAQLAPENIKGKGLDLTRYDLSIGEKIKIYDNLEIQLFPIISCNSTSAWMGENIYLDTVNRIEGKCSINFNSRNTIYYDFAEVKHYMDVQKIIFMIKSDIVGNFMNLEFAEDTWGYGEGLYGVGLWGVSTQTHASYLKAQYNIVIKNQNCWNMVEINTTCKDFRYMWFKKNSTSFANVYIDDVRFYGYYKNSYTANVISLDYDITKENEDLYSFELGEYDNLANDMLFSMKKRLESLEASMQES